MRPHDRASASLMEKKIIAFNSERHALPGIKLAASRASLLEQIFESIHRVKYISVIAQRSISPLRIDPTSELFDPLKAALICKHREEFEEACWLVFLSVHFGKNLRTGWRLTAEIYGGASRRQIWSFKKFLNNNAEFIRWLTVNGPALTGKFGNHRKYESLRTDSSRGTAKVFESYASWITSAGSHVQKFHEASELGCNDRGKTFDILYQSMNEVLSFGRMAKFDYLTMLGKLGLAPLEPHSPYLHGATGPLKGARLLFGGDRTANVSHITLDKLSSEFGKYIGVGMQVIEDSLCNWQKSPEKFIAFRG